MVFVWDRRKIKMLYSRGLSEMSRRIVCRACALNLEGADLVRGGGDEAAGLRECAFAVDAAAARVWLSSDPPLHPIRLRNKSGEGDTHAHDSESNISAESHRRLSWRG